MPRSFDMSTDYVFPSKMFTHSPTSVLAGPAGCRIGRDDTTWIRGTRRPVRMTDGTIDVCHHQVLRGIADGAS